MNIDYKQVERAVNYVFDNATEGDADSIIKTIDEFCYKYEWCMNVGDVKGEIVKGVFNEHKPKIVVELGGYYGYSAIMFASLQKDIPGSQYYSIEYDGVLACVIEKLVRFAGLEDKVTVIRGDLTKALPILKNKYGVEQVDLMFIDHLKTLYLSDFKLAEEHSMFKSGTVVVADNVITPGAPDYIKYMMDHQAFKTNLVETEFEYSNGKEKDGILISVNL